MNKLKYYFLSLFLFLFLIPFFSGKGQALTVPPGVNAKAAIVMDMETGQVLAGKNIHVKTPPASLTKVLTTIIAIEEGDLEEIVTVSRKAAYQEGSSIWLKEGEKLSLEELLYGVMLASGNDAAVAVAEHISGSVEKFAQLMNEKARQIGCLNSNFVNPSGLPDPDHYSTAYDQAKIMAYAMKNEVFARITSTKYKTISWADNDWGRGLRNHNKLLWSYADITGGKTGYTRAAGRCLLATAQREGREVVAVVLNSPDDWLEVRRLLDYGIDNFRKKIVMDKGERVFQLEWEDSLEKKLNLIAGDQLIAVIPKGGQEKFKTLLKLDPELILPIKKGDKVGVMQLLQGDNLIAEVDLLAQNDLNYRSIFLRFWYWIKEELAG